MFTERTLTEPLEAVRETHAPEALVFDCAQNFETLPSAQAEELGLVIDAFHPHEYKHEWLPPDAPDALVTYVDSELAIGMPEDGSVVWTRQTDPPIVFCKPILDESPDAFAEFLIAEALVESGLGEPEQFLGFYEGEYRAFADGVREKLSPGETYQLAAACYTAYLGLQTRDIFAQWDDPLFSAWVDAGERLEGRLAELPSAIARGQTSFTDGAELACSAIKHGGEIPMPFQALDASVYLEHGAAYAVEWATRTVSAVE